MENLLISERIKLQSYHQLYTNNYFLRTVQKQEIDFVEESGGQIHAYEFKWNAAGRNKIPASFFANYSAQGVVVDKENFRNFILFSPDNFEFSSTPQQLQPLQLTEGPFNLFIFIKH